MKLYKLFGAFIMSAGLLIASELKSPESKICVNDVVGTADIFFSQAVNKLTKNSVYNAEGATIETGEKAAVVMVFSNDAGIALDSDTRIVIEKFTQTPFISNRTDMDMEPSTSQTRVYVPKGIVGLCTNELAAGSSMIYYTQVGSANIHHGRFVINNDPSNTTISVLDGDCVVSTRNAPTNLRLVTENQQAIITRNRITIQKIPSNKKSDLELLVIPGCQAKQSIDFEANTVLLAPDSFQQVIVATPTIPYELPVQFDVSPNTIK